MYFYYSIRPGIAIHAGMGGNRFRKAALLLTDRLGHLAR